LERCQETCKSTISKWFLALVMIWDWNTGVNEVPSTLNILGYLVPGGQPLRKNHKISDCKLLIVWYCGCFVHFSYKATQLPLKTNPHFHLIS
jgi:hypothetical protein